MGVTRHDSFDRTIHVVRHGETVWNRERRHQGQMDIPLSPDGERQAVQAGEYIASLPVTACFASDLSRAFETARLIVEPLGLTVTPVPELREVSYGWLEGKTREETLGTMGNESRFHDALDIHSRPENGESLADLGKRVGKFLDKFWTESESLPPGDVLFVSHGVTMRVLVATLLDLPLGSARSFHFDNCGLTTVQFRGAAPPLLRCYNDTSHLRAPVAEVAS